MEWWLPYAVMAGALFMSMVAPMPLPRSRRGASRNRAVHEYDELPEEDVVEPQRGDARYAWPPPQDDGDDLDPRPAPKYSRPSPRPEARSEGRPESRSESRSEPRADQGRRRATYVFDGEDDDDDLETGVRAHPAPAPEARRASPPEARRAPPPPERPRPAARVNGSGHERRTPVMTDAVSYFRDPTTLKDWPQAAMVEDTVRAFIDRWGGSKPAATTFRKVEVVPASNERAFAFLLAVEPERRGKETTVLARVCIPGENADRPSRFLVTKYFDHMGERFREDVAKTPQHSRGIIMVRDVSGDDGRGAVALDFEVPLQGDPYDDIRSDDVAQYKNLLNIMRMFA